MKLEVAQKEKLLEWIGAGLATADIHRLAAEFEPPFTLARQQLSQYRKSCGKDFERRRQTESSALGRGFAVRENRVRLLDKLARRLAAELLGDDEPDRREEYALPPQASPAENAAETAAQKKLSGAEIAALRAILSDLAAETGDRKKAARETSAAPELTVKVYAGFDPGKV